MSSAKDNSEENICTIQLLRIRIQLTSSNAGQITTDQLRNEQYVFTYLLERYGMECSRTGAIMLGPSSIENHRKFH